MSAHSHAHPGARAPRSLLMLGVAARLAGLLPLLLLLWLAVAWALAEAA